MSGPAPEARPYEEITTSARTWPLREAGQKRNLTINLCVTQAGALLTHTALTTGLS